MKCAKCGLEVPEGTKFCTRCGSKVEGAAPNKIGQIPPTPKRALYKNPLLYVVIIALVAISTTVAVCAVQLIKKSVSELPEATKQEVSITEPVRSEFKTYKIPPISISVPDGWTSKDESDTHFFYPSDGGLVCLSLTKSNMNKYLFGEDSADVFIESFSSTVENFEPVNDEMDKMITFIDDELAYNTRATFKSNEVQSYASIYVFATDNNICVLTFLNKGTEQSDEFCMYEDDIIDSIVVEETTEEATEESKIETVAPETEPEQKTEPEIESKTEESKIIEQSSQVREIINSTSSNGFWANGTGDYVATDLNVTDYAVLHIIYNGSHNFVVKLYREDEYEDLLVNTIGDYSGDVLIEGTGIYNLEIKATDSWNITSDGLSIDDTTSFSGSGDSVTGITSHAGGFWKITNSGESNFVVKQYGLSNGYMDLLVNKIGDYEGVVKVKPGDNIFFSIHSKGNWEIVKQ